MLSLYRTDSSTLSSTDLISSVIVGPGSFRAPCGFVFPCEISVDNVIAYIRTYQDTDGNTLGTGFLNLETLFPCITSRSASDVPRCSRQTLGEDGFNKGNAVVDTADSGLKFQIFGRGISTYAFAVTTCSDFTPPSDGCLRDGYSFAVACYLPRVSCA